MKKVLLLGIIVGIFLISFIQNEAFALSCAPLNMNQDFEQADVVFIGIVTEKEYATPDIATSTLQVKEVFKGSLDDTVKIKSDERNWGINLIEGWSYLIFAADKGDFLEVGLCTRSAAVPPIPSSEQKHDDYGKRTMMMLEIVLMDVKPAPFKQLEQGVYHSDIICNSDLVLIGKIDGTPACVKESSIEKLVERGWAQAYYAEE